MKHKKNEVTSRKIHCHTFLTRISFDLLRLKFHASTETLLAFISFFVSFYFCVFKLIFNFFQCKVV